MTFVLPGLSAILKHFGIDFSTQNDQGFSVYLAVAHMIFDWISPLSLTAVLGLATGALWWLIRPKPRDVFWRIEAVDPALELKRIAALTKLDVQQASQDLLDLFKDFPDYQPARLFYAEWHHKTGNHRAALKGYERAFALGVAKARHYYMAAFAASKLGQNEHALRILQEAERSLPSAQMTGPMFYNMACYYSRLREPDRALAYLRRALAAGYAKVEIYKKDPDLAPLRSHPGFQRLLAAAGGK
jgi:tetratricopeptide (TPR) repeat protein